jgi:hypothetical protein
MLRTAALCILFAAAAAPGGPQQKVPAPSQGPATSVPCDPDGLIRCTLHETETVTGSSSIEDVRFIARYLELITERNRRYYLSWGTRLPSAAFELVRRVKSFPYVPYGDTYSIIGMDIALNQKEDRLSVRYPKYPKQNSSAPVAEKDHAVYDTKLSTFIKDLEKEIARLKKYEK